MSVFLLYEEHACILKKNEYIFALYLFGVHIHSYYTVGSPPTKIFINEPTRNTLNSHGSPVAVPRPAPVVSRCPELWSWTPPRSPWATWYAQKFSQLMGWGKLFSIVFSVYNFWCFLLFEPKFWGHFWLSWHHWSLLTFEASKKLDATECWHCCPTYHMHSGCQMSSRAAIQAVFWGSFLKVGCNLT